MWWWVRLAVSAGAASALRARPSEQPGSAQRPSCELGWRVGGAPLLIVGFYPWRNRVRPRPWPVSRYAACDATSLVVLPAMPGSQATRRVTTTNSCRNSAAATAARACPSLSGLSLRVVRWA